MKEIETICPINKIFLLTFALLFTNEISTYLHV